MTENTPSSKRHLDHFVASRNDADAVFSSRLVADAAEIRKLDQHLEEFLRLLREDAKHHEAGILKAHAKAFEKELHDELEILFKSTRQDLELYEKILHALALYRHELRTMVDDPDILTLAKSELNYANLLLQTAHDKLDTLFLLFKKLR